MALQLIKIISSDFIKVLNEALARVFLSGKSIICEQIMKV